MVVMCDLAYGREGRTIMLVQEGPGRHCLSVGVSQLERFL